MPTISTDEAERLTAEGVPYVDVRTEREFADGHVPGALNVPYLVDRESGERTPNADFLKVMRALFDPSLRIIVGCHSGMRSARAARDLEANGFSQVLDMSAGFAGKKDPFGRLVPGWMQEGRDVEHETPSDRSYAALQRSAGEK